MKSTPISILEKQIKFYETFKIMLKGRDGIDHVTDESKIEGLICDCDKKIQEFTNAIKILNEATVSEGNICCLCGNDGPLTIGGWCADCATKKIKGQI